MKQPNTLITAGCSYSQVPNRDESWPMHLQELHGIRYIAHTGHGAAGNATIARKLISKVMEALELGHKPEDILVGVMWSGTDRQSHYSPNFDHNWTRVNVMGPDKEDFLKRERRPNNELAPPFFDLQDPKLSSMHEEGRRYHLLNQTHQQWYNSTNPLVIRNFTNPSHYIFNAHWNDEMTSHYYERFVNPDKALLETCEHILRTQWFLQSKGIKYFFTEYDWDCFSYGGPHGYGSVTEDHSGHNFTPCGDPAGGIYSKHSESIQYPGEYSRQQDDKKYNDPEINYLYAAIDRDYFLPVKHMNDWVTNVSEHDHPRPGDPHPGTKQHKDFTQQIILPFLLEKYNIQ